MAGLQPQQFGNQGLEIGKGSAAQPITKSVSGKTSRLCWYWRFWSAVTNAPYRDDSSLQLQHIAIFDARRANALHRFNFMLFDQPDQTPWQQAADACSKAASGTSSSAVTACSREKER